VISLITITFSSLVAWGQVRTIQFQKDDILTVKTALGIATILQIPETVQSAIIGDYSGFKVEHIDKAVTIKPLRPGARTNLYLMTERRRYNIRLVTAPQEGADYIVYLKARDVSEPTTKWMTLNRSFDGKRGKLTVQRIGISSSGVLLIEASLSANSRASVKVSPEDFWLTQDGSSVTLNSLYVSSLKAAKDSSVLIGVSILPQEIDEKKEVTLEYRGSEVLRVSIKEPVRWK
jgi:hypothetical protein